MTSRPFVTVPHRAVPGDTIRLYATVPVPFASLMASLYPLLASTVSTKRGYAAFAGDGRFIGIMTSTGLTSVRRNPFLVDDTDLFLRALLAGLALDKHKTWSAYCDWDNYGTLRLMQKLGLGARPSRKGHISNEATPEAVAYLAEAVAKAKPAYLRHREYAERRLSQLTEEARAALIPTVEQMGAPTASMDVTLL